jgi:hypothetical protein
MATLAFFIPARLASCIPKALREDHFFVRWSKTVGKHPVSHAETMSWEDRPAEAITKAVLL